MEPDKRENVITVIAYEMRKFPKNAVLKFCVDAEQKYDFILIKNFTADGSLRSMTQYCLMGNPEKYGKVYQWKNNEDWTMVSDGKPIYHDIRDIYSIVCQYQSNNWKVKLRN